jgi:hypothetical protein
MKIRPVRAELFQANTRTATTKLTVAFRNFANAAQKALTGQDSECLRLGFEPGTLSNRRIMTAAFRSAD